MNTLKDLRLVIRSIISEMKMEEKEELLGEPDDPSGQEEKEASVAAAVPGVTVPLGASPTFPKKSRKKRRSLSDYLPYLSTKKSKK